MRRSWGPRLSNQNTAIFFGLSKEQAQRPSNFNFLNGFRQSGLARINDKKVIPVLGENPSRQL